jgi:formate hydrogenlyase transcriptional activator
MAEPALRSDAIIPFEGSAVGWVYTHRCVHVRPNLQQKQEFLEDEYYVQEGLGRMINLPLTVRDRCLGTLNIGSIQSGYPGPADLKFLQQVATQIAYAIDHVQAYERIKRLTEQLRHENEYLAAEVKASRIPQQLKISGISERARSCADGGRNSCDGAPIGRNGHWKGDSGPGGP